MTRSSTRPVSLFYALLIALGLMAAVPAGSTGALSALQQSEPQDREPQPHDDKLLDKRDKKNKSTPFTRRAKARDEYRAKIEREYEETGDLKQCIGLRQIRDTKVLDDQTIFFKGSGGNGYMNTLNTICPRLAFEERFTYLISGGTAVCQGQIIAVLDNFGRQWGACSLGEFVHLKKIKKKDRKAETPDD